jgi:hypothetical protein
MQAFDAGTALAISPAPNTLETFMKFTALIRRSSSATVASLPSRLERHAALVLRDWTGLQACTWTGGPLSPAQEALLVTLTLEGPRRAQFAVSAPRGLGALMAVAGTGDPGATSFSVEAVVELVHLLREPLLDLLQQDGQDCLSHGPRLAHSSELPQRPAHSDLCVGVGGYPLRLRLWID